MNANVLTAATPALNHLHRLAYEVSRRGTTLRFRCAPHKLDGATRQELAEVLLQAGAGVTVSEVGQVTRATRAKDGTLVWDGRHTRRAQEHTTFVVEL